MDTLFLSRLQFATTTSIHFLFVTLSLGLVVFVVSMQTAYTITGKPVYARMTKFWGKIYVVNYALGIVTGLVMEFQFGLNWSGLSKVVGNVFGVPIALETLVAFFAEATFLGMWIFGWNRLPKWVHLALIWLVAVTAYVSAFWILVANAFLQHPVGYEMRDGQAYLTDFGALMSNTSLTDSLLHVVFAALLAGGLFVAGISAWHFIRRTQEVEVFRRSLRWGLVAAPVGAFAIIHYGFLQEVVIERNQPMKLAQMYQEPARIEAAGKLLLQQFGPGDFAPPSWISVPYQIMMNSAFVMALTTLVCLVLLLRNWVVRLRVPLYVLVAMIPLPFVSVISGWLVREVGRQPWTVYGMLTTEQAVSDVDSTAVLLSFVGFTAVLGTLVIIDYWLIARYVRRGPDDSLFGTVLEPAPSPVPSAGF
ncbi:cytochrome ubiquinol oxidase subunit I [Streptosporangium sp. NPDC000396]|uniref:cytochrome ubiquinol oxidase subunit I n=1 Tax=Streptosporangium sp. NPDC000396 TaxID=3366185 RepID=UPI00369F09E5